MKGEMVMKTAKGILRELIEIKKLLQDIELILEYKFVPHYRGERTVTNGKTIRTCHILEDPLEELRKAKHIRQPHHTD